MLVVISFNSSHLVYNDLICPSITTPLPLFTYRPRRTDLSGLTFTTIASASTIVVYIQVRRGGREGSEGEGCKETRRYLEFHKKRRAAGGVERLNVP